jgi:hypothetical protein
MLGAPIPPFVPSLIHSTATSGDAQGLLAAAIGLIAFATWVVIRRARAADADHEPPTPKVERPLDRVPA